MKRFAKVLMLGAMFAGTANAQDVHIKGITVNGTGCPVGSVTADVSSDKKAFTVLFDNYIAQTGSGIALTEARKFCQVVLDLNIPNGFQYSVFKADYAGFASLVAGARGVQNTTYYFQGNLVQNVTLKTELKGPMNKDYIISDEIGLASVVWSQCNVSRSLNLKTAINLVAPRNTSNMMTVDSVDGEVKQKYHLAFRPCRP